MLRVRERKVEAVINTIKLSGFEEKGYGTRFT